MLVGLTGGIGSGKSTVAAKLAERGALIIDADQVARDLQSSGSPLVAAMVAEFGSGILGDDGALDRAAVAELVFGDDVEHRENLARLNRVTHPPIHGEIERQIAAAVGRHDVVVLDHPLLVERPRDDLDLLVVVDVPVEVQLHRLVDKRGMDPKDARRRISSQASRDDRLARADIVIDNSRDLAALDEQLDALWLRFVNS